MKKGLHFKKLTASLLLSAFMFLNFNFAAIAAENPPASDSLFVSGSADEKALIEHLPTYKKTEINTVSITANKATINKGNVLKIAFANKFSTKTAKVGDKITFVLKKDLITAENRILLPAGTQIIATVQEITPTKIWNRNAKVLLSLGEVVLPDGKQGTLAAKVHAKDAVLKKSSWAAVGKAALWTVGLFGVGAGIGAAIGAAADAVGVGCLAIGMPVGGGLGLIIGSMTKGLNYNAKPGKTIYIELTEDLDISY
ncbi:MAG: hypothetical protein KHX03_05155 [Clostridium sp.]|nr:hypothetical protein [Clostridium sp.]